MENGIDDGDGEGGRRDGWLGIIERIDYHHFFLFCLLFLLSLLILFFLHFYLICGYKYNYRNNQIIYTLIYINSYPPKIHSHATANPCRSQSYCGSSLEPTSTHTLPTSDCSTPHYVCTVLSRPSNHELSDMHTPPSLSFLCCRIFPSTTTKINHSINPSPLHELTKMGLSTLNDRFCIWMPSKQPHLIQWTFP